MSKLASPGFAGFSTPDGKCAVSRVRLNPVTTNKETTGSSNNNVINVEIIRMHPVSAKRALMGSGADTVIRGMFNIRKSSISKHQIEETKRELTVTPATSQSAPGPPPKPYILYQESGTWLSVPRYYGMTKYGTPGKSMLGDGEPISVTLTGTPRPYQVDVLAAIASVFRGNGAGGGVFVEADCGTGKTFMGICAAVRHGRKTAILVHKGDLMGQWVQRFEEFTDARVGIVRSNTVEVEDKDICIFMAQSVWSGKYPKHVFDTFGLLIVDEW